MCLPKRRQKTKENKQILSNLIKKRKTLFQNDDYPRFFLELLLFMEESLKQQISSPIQGICSCSNIPDAYVRQRFHQSYQDCSTSQKLNYLELTHQAILNPPQIQAVQRIKTRFNIFVRNFIPWTSKQTAKLNGFRFVTEDYQIDLRRYLVRQSRSGIKNCFVVEALCDTKPQKLRFTFEQNSQTKSNIANFLQVARLGFMHTAQIWSRKIDHVKLRSPKTKVKFNADENFPPEPKLQNKWTQIFRQESQSQNGEKKLQKQPKIRTFKFTEESQDEEKKQKIPKTDRRVRTQRSESPPNQRLEGNIGKIFKEVPTVTTLTLPSTHNSDEKSKKRKSSIALLAYEPMARNQKNILKNLIPNYDITAIEDLEQFDSLSQTQSDDETHMYIHKTKSQIKAKVKTMEVPSKLIVLGLIDYLRYREWNRMVTGADIYMKLQSENCFLSYIKFKNMDKPFAFLTHLCEYKESYYIAIKPLQDNSTKKGSLFQSMVIKVFTEKNYSKIICHIMFKGNSHFAIDFIKSIQNLEQFLSDKSSKQSLHQYLKFGRRIDKELQNEPIVEFQRSHEYSYASWEFGNMSELSKDEHMPKFFEKTFFSIDSFMEEPQ